MNAKNIISAILMVLSFAACSSDIEGLDNNMANSNGNNGETSISVRMTASDIATKSAGQDNLTAGTELAIKSYVIAVFEKVSGQRIGYATSISENGSAVNTTIQGIDTKEGDVNVIAVANVNVNDFNNLYSYEEFSNKIVNNLTDLVKVGTTSTKLTKGANQINIDLYQLTARVNVQLTTEVEKIGSQDKDVVVSFTATKYSTKIATSSTILNPTTNTANAENIKGAYDIIDVNSTSFSYTTYAVNNAELSVTTNLTVTVDGQVVKSDIGKEIPVSFKKGSSVLTCLENGKNYTQDIQVKVTINSGVDVTSTFTYEVAPISEINNEITFN